MRVEGRSRCQILDTILFERCMFQTKIAKRRQTHSTNDNGIVRLV